MKGNLWIMLVVVVFSAIGVLAIPTALSSNADVSHANETHTLSSTSNVTLGNASVWYRMVQNETVQSQPNGTEFENGTDYRIFYETGNITAIAGSPADGETVYVDHSYQTLDERSEDIAGLLAILEWAFPLLILVVAFGTVMAWTGWMT